MAHENHTRCYACNKLCYDKELKEDSKGWKLFQALCKKCLGSIDIDFSTLDKKKSYGNYNR